MYSLAWQASADCGLCQAIASLLHTAGFFCRNEEALFLTPWPARSHSLRLQAFTGSACTSSSQPQFNKTRASTATCPVFALT